MSSRLSKMNRVAFVESTLRYIESIKREERVWTNTARALVALRNNKDLVTTTASEQHMRRNASSIALRLLLEMAISTSPIEGGHVPGELDLTPLMADAALMFQFGGYSDAIRKEVMRPNVRIAGNGDILMHPDFYEAVVEPLARETHASQWASEIGSYERLFEERVPVGSVKGLFPDDFLQAFQAEFDVTIDTLRAFQDALEDLAVDKKRCVFVARKSELLNRCLEATALEGGDVEAILRNFALWPRPSWQALPKGFMKKDWYPWRFRRRLSLVARPLVRVEDVGDPRFAISPGLVRECTLITIRRHFEAEVEPSECRSKKMKQWVDRERNRLGHRFCEEVQSCLKENGYTTLLEQKMGALLNENFDRNYGDVDVLAWKPGQLEVFSIECKDLRTAITLSEMSEQLNRFGGRVLPDGERDELLKHIDRCILLQEKSARLAATIGVKADGLLVKPVVCFSARVPMQYVAHRFPEIRFVTLEEIRELGTSQVLSA